MIEQVTQHPLRPPHHTPPHIHTYKEIEDVCSHLSLIEKPRTRVGRQGFCLSMGTTPARQRESRSSQVPSIHLILKSMLVLKVEEGVMVFWHEGVMIFWDANRASARGCVCLSLSLSGGGRETTQLL